ncbi:MAG: TolB family protein [Chloroflexi bacterium]|nr:TolB family protein [Chloroflexota bacterium]
MLKLKFLTALLAFLCLTMSAVPTHSQTQLITPAERIAFAAFRHGQWDIYSIAPDGSDPRQLTNAAAEDTDPAYSPDGTKIAFASRRDGNWDVYVLDLQGGEETRLTSSPHYDGAPAWSPDGQQIAYESYQNGDLDIWLVDAAGADAAANLTSDSEAGDFAPAWSPDGRTLAFTSWRQGSKDLYLLDLENEALTHLTSTPTAEEYPVWQPDGSQLAFVIDNLGDREVFAVDIAASNARGVLDILPKPEPQPMPVTWLGRTDGPAWGPAGDRIAAVFHRWDGEIIAIQTPGADHELPQLLTEPIIVQGRLTWHAEAINAGQTVATLADIGVSPLYEEQLFPNDDSEPEPYDLVRMNDVETGTPWLADTVNDSFLAWRFHIRDEVGYDFMSQLSDATRDLAQYSDTTQYASWHKSGRAIDTLFDYHLGAELAHEIVREDYSNNTYWRVFLRCTDQTGRCGRPLVANPWNYSTRARTVIAPEQGGIEKENLSGYYIDFTALGLEYGWERISSYDDEEFGWTWNFIAFEYWHYQKMVAVGPGRTGRLTWYQAMSDIYPPDELNKYFTWQKMRAVGDDGHLIALKGVPLPLEVKPWWALVER